MKNTTQLCNTHNNQFQVLNFLYSQNHSVQTGILEFKYSLYTIEFKYSLDTIFTPGKKPQTWRHAGIQNKLCRS